MPEHLVMEWLRRAPAAELPRAPSTSLLLLEAQLVHSSLSSPPVIPCNTPQLCSQCHTGVGKPAQSVTSGNHVPVPWTIKGQEQRPLVIHRQGQAGNQRIVVHQCGLVSQPTSVQAGSSKLPQQYDAGVWLTLLF